MVEWIRRLVNWQRVPDPVLCHRCHREIGAEYSEAYYKWPLLPPMQDSSYARITAAPTCLECFNELNGPATTTDIYNDFQMGSVPHG